MSIKLKTLLDNCNTLSLIITNSIMRYTFLITSSSTQHHQFIGPCKHETPPVCKVQWMKFVVLLLKCGHMYYYVVAFTLDYRVAQ